MAKIFVKAAWSESSQYPTSLPVYSLLCYPLLLASYSDIAAVVKKPDTINQISRALQTVPQSPD